MYNHFICVLFRSIKWNFGKFIVDKSGQPVERFAPTIPPHVSLSLNIKLYGSNEIIFGCIHLQIVY